MNIVIIKYNAGNTCSVDFSLQRLGIQATITDDPELILAADKVIFPGVGSAGTAMAYLHAKKLDTVIKDLRQPVLGICLGMQLLCAFSEEEHTTCLGIFDQRVKKFDVQEKVPHMGWNNIHKFNAPLFKHVDEQVYVYFVHSYYAALSEDTVCSASYGIEFSAALQKNNFYAVQFHPEKSAITGQQIIENFLQL